MFFSSMIATYSYLILLAPTLSHFAHVWISIHAKFSSNKDIFFIVNMQGVSNHRSVLLKLY